jgi:hypothetical protein
VSSTQKVRLVERNQVKVTHEVEVIDYHVGGWKRYRCLTHGHHDITTDRGDDIQTALGAARQCRHFYRLPFAPAPHPIAPTLQEVSDEN